MPTQNSSMSVVFRDATGSTAVQTYSEMIILGADGHKVETFTPKGVADAAPVANVTIDGLSQFSGLTSGSKNLVITNTPNTASWDGGEAVTIETSTAYTLYDSDANNFLLVTIGGSIPTPVTEGVTVQDGCLSNAITVLQLDDELLTSAPIISDAAGNACSALGTYPRPTAVTNYAIYDTDKSLVAIKNTLGSTTLSVDYSIYNQPRSYTSLTSLEADHKADTLISKAAAKVFSNGGDHVSVINTYDGSSGANYATCLTQLETEHYDYDIMIPVVDVSDGNFVLCSTHAITYTKVIVAPKIGTVTAVRAAMGGLTRSEVQYAIAYNDSTYTVGELSGATAAAISKTSPWIPCEWNKIAAINASGYSEDEILELEGSSTTLRVNTIINIGSITALSSGRALAAGTWIDVPRTKQYLQDLVQDAWVNAKIRINNANQKIPYTTEGLTTVESIIRKALSLAQSQGALRADYYDTDGDLQYGFVISMPDIDDIPISYKNERKLPYVAITAYLSGAIETINPLYFTVALGEV